MIYLLLYGIIGCVLLLNVHARHRLTGLEIVVGLLVWPLIAALAIRRTIRHGK